MSDIALEEPQAAYSSFVKAICHRWTYIQRTVPNINHLFEPLELAIREKLIPSLIGRTISDIERRIFALPVRFGGMGINDPSKSSSHEFEASKKITRSLTDIIVNQEGDYQNYDKREVDNQVLAVKSRKEKRLENELKEIYSAVSSKMKRVLELAKENGSGSWLTAIPKQSLGFTLNKQEFRDSVFLRYGWDIPNTPIFCQCGQKNDVDHVLSCKKGGYMSMRHNRIRDLEAEFMREVGFDVRTEPILMPIGRTNAIPSGNTSQGARLDVSGVGIWGAYEKTFLDIRIMHPNCPSYVNKPIEKVYAQHEREKKRDYNERVLNVERASFVPIVGSTFGGMGPEANRYHKRIASLIADKRKESYVDVISYTRTRLRFSILKSILTAIRGIRGKSREASTISDISYNLVEY